MSSKRHTRSSDKAISSKRSRRATSSAVLPVTASASDDQLVEKITAAVSQVLKAQSSTTTQASSATPGQSVPSTPQPQPATLVQQSVAEAVEQITGGNLGTDNSSEDTTSKAQFMSVAAPLGSSVSVKIKNKIWGNEFIDLGLLLHVQPTEDTYSIKLQKTGGQQTLAIIPSQKKLSITGIEQWTNAFLVFAAIYCEKLPSEASGLMKYMSIVRDLALRSGNWRYYDESFRKLREVETLPWGQIHSEIWLRAHNVAKPGMQANFRAKQSSNSTPRGYCFKFHSGAQCNGCSFKHSCFKCGGGHPISRCTQTRSGQKSSRSNESQNAANTNKRS